MSFAGFAGLMNALRRRGESWAPIELYQLRIIVAYAITTLFGSLSTIPFVELFGQREGVQWLGGVMLIASSSLGFGNMLSDIRGGHGTTLPTHVRATFTTITILGLLLFLGTAITGALPRNKSSPRIVDRKSTRLNSSHRCNSYAVFCLKKKKRKSARVP